MQKGHAMTTESVKKWFLAQVKPNCLQIAERNLKRQGFETFLPKETRTRRIKDKFTSAATPLFPGYIFVAYDPDGGHWRSVNSTYGISKLVRFGAYPTSVPPGLIDALRERCCENGIIQPPATLSPGDDVVVTSGPFSDLIGRIERVESGKRVWVLLDLLGAQTRLSLAPDSVRLGAG